MGDVKMCESGDGLFGLSAGQIFDKFLNQFSNAAEELERCRKRYYGFEYDTDFLDDVEAGVFDLLSRDYEQAELHYRVACRNLSMFVFSNCDIISIDDFSFSHSSGAQDVETPDLKEEYWKD